MSHSSHIQCIQIDTKISATTTNSPSLQAIWKEGQQMLYDYQILQSTMTFELKSCSTNVKTIIGFSIAARKCRKKPKLLASKEREKQKEHRSLLGRSREQIACDQQLYYYYGIQTFRISMPLQSFVLKTWNQVHFNPFKKRPELQTNCKSYIGSGLSVHSV